MTDKSKQIVSWVLSGLAALAFLAAGAPKVAGIPEVVENFRNWGFSDSFRVFIGVCELAGALALLLPPFTALGASGLAIIMLGAIFTHLSHDQAPQALIPLTLLAILLYLTYVRRNGIAKLLGRWVAVPRQAQ